jgi:putative N6-adenine-specific DNA methylase
MAGSKACVISGSLEGFHAIGLKAAKKDRIFNGDIECEFRQYDLFQGKKALN